jgi:hypothetical protein
MYKYILKIQKLFTRHGIVLHELQVRLSKNDDNNMLYTANSIVYSDSKYNIPFF